MTVKHVDTVGPHGPHEEQAHRSAMPLARKRLAAMAGALFLSAIVYCGLVIWQRDSAMRNAAMAQVEQARTWIQDYLDKRSFLPPALPDDLQAELGAAAAHYPHRQDVPRLRGLAGPYLLVASARQGLVMPGRDGYAVVMYDHGKIFTTWLSPAQFTAEQEKRQELLEK